MACRIMIVDDQPDYLQIVREMVKDSPHISIVGQAGDGKEALRLVESLRPQAAVIDVHMPGLDGFETARRMRVRYPELRILIVSAYHEPAYEDLAQQTGASFLSKGQISSRAIIDALGGIE